MSRHDNHNITKIIGAPFAKNDEDDNDHINKRSLNRQLVDLRTAFLLLYCGSLFALCCISYDGSIDDMSRKARADRSGWNAATIYAFRGDYGPFKPGNKGQPIKDALILFEHRDNKDDGNEDDESDKENSTLRPGERQDHHPMYSLAGQAQELLLRQKTTVPFATMIVIDIRPMFKDIDEWTEILKLECEEVDLTRRLGKALVRTLDRLRLQNATLAAFGDMCPVLIKLGKDLRRKDATICSSLRLIHPVLTAEFVNKNLVNAKTQSGIDFCCRLCE